jgi:hypothetical protein
MDALAHMNLRSYRYFGDGEVLEDEPSEEVLETLPESTSEQPAPINEG